MSEQAMMLGAVLGGVMGTALFLLVTYLTWKWVKRKRCGVVVVVERAS